MSSCFDCKFFNYKFFDCMFLPNRDACVGVDPKYGCAYHSKREMAHCEHRHEKCINENCTVICRKNPSERGCDFCHVCGMDDYICDEKCEEHKNRSKKHSIDKKINKLKEAKYLIEELIKDMQKEM